jgi:hypothetical protein
LGQKNRERRYDDDYARTSRHHKERNEVEDEYSRMMRYQRERNEADDLCRSLEDNIHTMKLEFQRALKEEQDNFKALKNSAHELQKVKETRELVFGPQMTDDVIRTRFESLLADIRTWASEFACTTGQEPSFEEAMLSEYQRVAPSCETLEHLYATVKSEIPKQDKKQKRYFIRGWTSYIMIQSIFRTLDEQGTIGHDSWLFEDDSKAFERLEQRLWHAGE